MKRIAAGIAATLALALPAAASTIVTNGSFETGVPGNVAGNHNGASYGAMPGYGGWDIWTEIDGWKTVSGDGIEAQTNGTIGEVDAQDGQYYLEMDARGNSTMEQLVSLARGAYQLSFWYSPRSGDNATNGVDYALGSLVAGTVTGPSGAEGTAVGQWTQFVSSFSVASAGSFALRFGGSGRSDGYGGLIDNVAITAQPSDVPVPAAGLLLLGGVGGLGALRKRRA